MLDFSSFQNNYNETRVGYDWTGQHVSSYVCLFPSRAMTTITITVIQRKPERFMMKHTNSPQMTLSELFFLFFFSLTFFVHRKPSLLQSSSLCRGGALRDDTKNGCDAVN